MEYYTFTKAKILHYSRQDRDLFRRLENRVPENLRGVFEIMAAPAPGNIVSFEGIRIQPNPPLYTLNALYALATGKVDPLCKIPAQHVPPEFSKEQLMPMLFDKAPFTHTEAIIQEQRKVNREAKKENRSIECHSLSDGTYSISYDIDQVLTRTELHAEDKALIAKIAKAIPANQHGFFICDFTTNGTDSKPLLQSLLLDPNAATLALSAGVGQNIGKGHPRRTKILDRDQLEVLAMKLPDSTTPYGDRAQQPNNHHFYR